MTHLYAPTSLFLISVSVCSPHAGVSYHINLQVHCTFLLLFLDLFDFYVYERFSSMCTICVPGTLRRQKGTLDTLEPEL